MSATLITTTTETPPATLQWTPDGAAELARLRRRRTCGPFRHAACETQPARRHCIAPMPPPSRSGASRSPTRTARSRHRAGHGLAGAAGEVLRTSHNGLLPPTGAVARKLAWCASAGAPFGWAATPVMSSPRSACNTDARAAGAASTSIRRAARAVIEEAPPPTRAAQPRRVAPLTRRSCRRVCSACPSAPRGGSPTGPPIPTANSQQPNAASMRCKPNVSARTAQDSVLKSCRVKAKPPSRRGQSRGLDPFTTVPLQRPRTANSRRLKKKAEPSGNRTPRRTRFPRARPRARMPLDPIP